MTCEPCTYSPESEEDSLPTSSLDIRQLSLLSGSHTPAESCENELPKDGSPACTCGKGTLDCSIHPSTPEAWTAFMRDSLAKTLALLESRQAYLREPEVVFTAKSSESLAWFDRDTCSWRTYQQSFLTDSELYSQTWPRWGMTLGGAAYAHPMSERRITETDGSYLPTPTTMDGVLDKMTGGATVYMDKTGKPRRAVDGGGSASMGLARLVQYWPTLRANKIGGVSSANFRPTLAAQVGGQLNPDWVGWLMGFPIAWASSKATATHKSHCKPQQPGDCSEGQ